MDDKKSSPDELKVLPSNKIKLAFDHAPAYQRPQNLVPKQQDKKDESNKKDN